MYNQCLNCGAVYPKGSPEVFQGCSRCGKAKFSFTNNPVPVDELLELKKEANDDLGMLMREIFDRNMVYTRPDKRDEELIGQDTKGWIKVSVDDVPDRMKERGAERPPRDSGHSTEKPLLSVEDMPEGEGISEGGLIEEILRENRKSETPKAPVKRKRKRVGKPVWDRRVRLGRGAVEVVRETEEGVFEIDLGRMLDKMLKKTPVVMMEKGVYLINLGGGMDKKGSRKETE